MDKNITRKLRVIGSWLEIKKFEAAIAMFKDFDSIPEGQARLLIQGMLDAKIAKVTVLFDGNSVYSKKVILASFKKLLKNYSEQAFSDTLYKFISQTCGSIAHYNLNGWFATYPTKQDLTRFFKSNEYGNSVLGHQPSWATDRIAIIMEMNKLLKIPLTN